MSHSKAYDAMSIEPKADAKKAETKEIKKEVEVVVIPLGKRYIQMQQLVAEEILRPLESTYDFITAVREACEIDGSLDPEVFIEQGLAMLQSALNLDTSERVKLSEEDEDEDEEEGEDEEDGEEGE
jgi:hypothetical protein